MPRTYEFVVGTQGLSTSIDHFFWENDWQRADLPANVSWEHVRVRDRGDVCTWIAAKNRWLTAAWTPNQSIEDREDGAIDMAEAERQMKALENLAAV